MCDLALVHKAKDGINPLNRACNSRLGESQGWPLNPLPPPATLSSNNPGKFYDIQSLPHHSHKWHIHLTEMFKFTTVIPFKQLTTESSDKCTCMQTCVLAYGISRPEPANEQMVVRCLEVRRLPEATVPPGFRETLSTYPSSLRSYRPSLLWSDVGGPYTAPPAALVNPDTSRPREPKDRLSSSPLAALGIVPGSL